MASFSSVELKWSGESSNVPRDGWLNRCDEHHHEREDGNLRVALPQVHSHGRLDSGEWAPWSNSVISQLWLIWRNTLFCPNHGMFQSVHTTTMSDINPRVFKEFKVTLPISVTEEKCLRL